MSDKQPTKEEAHAAATAAVLEFEDEVKAIDAQIQALREKKRAAARRLEDAEQARLATRPENPIPGPTIG